MEVVNSNAGKTIGDNIVSEPYCNAIYANPTWNSVNPYDDFVDIVKDRALGVLWGAVDGLNTGLFASVNVAGDGFWIVGGISQIYAAIAGSIVGCISGAAGGLIMGTSDIRNICKEYRLSFGTAPKRVPGQTPTYEIDRVVNIRKKNRLE
ncbi:ABC-type transport system permease [Trichoplusia ni ascovirus 6b]|nr:ABC-type transport system permease [Trichoplusia ni ascovirus 6b]